MKFESSGAVRHIDTRNKHRKVRPQKNPERDSRYTSPGQAKRRLGNRAVTLRALKGHNKISTFRPLH
jgi:hypothetical protein